MTAKLIKDTCYQLSLVKKNNINTPEVIVIYFFFERALF